MTSTRYDSKYVRRVLVRLHVAVGRPVGCRCLRDEKFEEMTRLSKSGRVSGKEKAKLLEMVKGLSKMKKDIEELELLVARLLKVSPANSNGTSYLSMRVVHCYC